MDRDFTQETEEELIRQVYPTIDFLDRFTFSSVAIESDAVSQYQAKINSTSADLFNLYTNAGNKISERFNMIRATDSDYASYCTIEHFFKLQRIITKLDNIINCVLLPELGDTPEEIKQNLSTYKDSILDNSIFGDGWDYACAVSENGFKELAENSMSAYDHYYNMLVTVSEDGSVTYDMEEILSTLAKPASEIKSAEYDAITLAYIYMSEEEMAEVFKRCMIKVDDVEYGFNLGMLAGLMNEDYSSWTVDEDKFVNISCRLEAISYQCLETIRASYEIYEENEDITYKNLGDEYKNTRRNILQRQNLFNSLISIDSYHGVYEAEYPTINVYKAESDYDNSSFVLEFKEFKNVGSSESPVFSNLADSKITVSYVIEPYLYDMIETENIKIAMEQRFSYDAEGNFAKFIAEEIRDESIGSMADDLTNTTLSNVLPVLGDVVFGAVDMVIDYEKAKEDSIYITTEFENMQNNNMYDLFGCIDVVVEYDTSDNKDKMITVSEGIYTEQRIEAFNSLYPQYEISIDDVFSDPGSVVDIVLEIIHNIYIRDGLSIVRDIGGSIY